MCIIPGNSGIKCPIFLVYLALPLPKKVRQHSCHNNGMKTTIDRAGRLVIPAQVRKKAGFAPGTEIEIVQDDVCVRLFRKAKQPKLQKRGKLVVAVPTAKRDLPELDLAKIVEAERNRWPG